MDIPILNQRLKIYGYQTIGELIHDFVKSKFPPIYDDEELKIPEKLTIGRDMSIHLSA